MRSTKFEWENYKSLLGRIVLILVIPFLMYSWGLAIIANVANFWNVFTPTGEAGFSKEMVGNRLPVLPPSFTNIPKAVKDAKLAVSGYSQEGLQIKIYLNDQQAGNVRADKSGQFSFDGLVLHEGENKIYAKAVDDRQIESETSDKYIIKYLKKPPFLELTNLGDNADIKQKDNIFNLNGKTQTGASVTINGSLVFVDNNGGFIYPLALNDGSNNIEAVATDEAGNTTKITRTANFTKQP